MKKRGLIITFLKIFPALSAFNIVGYSHAKNIADELTGFNASDFRILLFNVIFGMAVYYILMIIYIYQSRDRIQNYKKEIAELVLICMFTCILYIYLIGGIKYI